MRFDAREFSDYIKLLQDFILAGAADINTIIESLRALKAEHSRILDVGRRLAKRMKVFERDCRAALLIVASIAVSR
jgi:hypothetical protein